MGELLQHQLDGDAGALDHRLAYQDSWVSDDTVLVSNAFLGHSPSIILLTVSEEKISD